MNHEEQAEASIHVVASLSDAAAGPTYSVTSLLDALVRQGAPACAYTIEGWRRSDWRPPPRAFVERSFPIAGWPGARSVAASPAMARALRIAARDNAILHSHGLWLMPNIYPARAVGMEAACARHIVSPRGMLGAEALRFSSLKKRVFWLALQRSALRGAHCLHATADQEYAEIRSAGLDNPVAIIPNGIDVPEAAPRPAERVPYTLLSLGRLHPKKGLMGLIEAWAVLAPAFPDWRLRIIGPDENGHAAELNAAVRQAGLPRVTIEGAVFGEDRANAYAMADVFVLPSLNENFAMTVAEALAARVPVVASKGTPWAGLVEHRCGWWVDRHPATLVPALRDAMMRDPAERRAMGERGAAWMAADFSWDSVAERMRALYRWVHAGGEVPHFVRQDR